MIYSIVSGQYSYTIYTCKSCFVFLVRDCVYDRDVRYDFLDIRGESYNYSTEILYGLR